MWENTNGKSGLHFEICCKIRVICLLICYDWQPAQGPALPYLGVIHCFVQQMFCKAPHLLESLSFSCNEWSFRTFTGSMHSATLRAAMDFGH